MSKVTFNAHTALTSWQASPFSLLVVAMLIGASYWYLRADWQLAIRGRRWPRHRTAAFLAGLVTVDLALQSPVATFTGTYFQAHVIQHLLLMVVAPPLLALGAPSTLLLQTASRRTKVTWLAVLRSRPFALLTHPVPVWFLYFGVMFAFFLSSLINLAMHHPALMDLMNVVFLFGGCLYWWPLVGADPIVHWKMGYGVRMVIVLLGAPPEVILGLAILSARSPIASMYTLASTHAGGGLLWVTTEFAVIAGFAPIFWQWMRSDERAAARADARIHTPQPATAFTATPVQPELPATPVQPESPIPKPLSNWEAMWLLRTGYVPQSRDDGSWVTVDRRGSQLPAQTLQPAGPAVSATVGPSARQASPSSEQPGTGRAARGEAHGVSTDRGFLPVRRGRRRAINWIIGAAATLIVVAVVGPPVFFHLIEGDAPASLRLPAVAKGSLAAGPVSGAWTVSTGSQAGYRVQEILFEQHHTAVGRTTQVSGGLVISGTTVTVAEFSVDMAAVKSDQPSRDAQFHGYILETYKHRTASFRLSQPIQLGGIPAPGNIITAAASGRLTLRGVTRPVAFEIHAERLQGAIDVNADIPITFSLWHIPNPSFAITQVGKTGVIEVLLHLTPQTP